MTPLTLDVRVQRQPPSGALLTVRQRVTRTADRIHIAPQEGREWLFRRNPRDPGRVSASAIDHRGRVILEYEESDLRNHLGIRGWADVLTLGFDLAHLDGLQPSRSVRTVAGIRFVRYTSGKGASEEGTWWSEEQALSSAYEMPDGTGVRRFRIEHARAGVNADVLRPPVERFPGYPVFDLSEWLEGH